MGANYKCKGQITKGLVMWPFGKKKQKEKPSKNVPTKHRRDDSDLLTQTVLIQDTQPAVASDHHFGGGSSGGAGASGSWDSGDSGGSDSGGGDAGGGDGGGGGD
jgi:hypothetical protein